MTQEQFIAEIAKYVQKYAPQYGIAVCSPIIAQACLESAYGTSKKAKYHNYFGLKYRANRVTCNKGYFSDGGSEQNGDGTYTTLPSSTAWYAFENLEKGVLGYFQFTNISTYSNLKGVTDPYTYLELIKKDGYATSLNYVKNVYNVIQKWNLTKYDTVNNTDSKGGNKMLVAIDAGHGSNTAGKRTVDGHREHWINVKVAYYCEQALRKSGLDTVRIAWDDLDATDDAEVDLTTRQNQVKKSGAKVCISCHANAHGNGAEWTSAKGLETLYHNDPTKAKNSKKLADLVQKYMLQGTPQTNRGTKPQSLAMCNCPAMGVDAAVLIEIGFMTNEHEANLMKTDAFCKEQGEQAAHGICDYLGVPYLGGGSVATPPVQTTTPNSTSQLYRVRKSWDDAKSQLGAYSNLENAKKACKSGYSVFDNDGNKVYPTSSTVAKQPSKDEIKAIQLWLNLNYNCNLIVDGIFGVKSKDALVKAVQKEIGVTQDGKFDTTLNRLAISKNKIKYGSKGNLVSLWQAYLITKGYDPNGFDGIFGVGCTLATKHFQAINKITANGTVGPGTWTKALG